MKEKRMDDFYISRWKLNRDNFTLMLELLTVDKENFVPIEELGIISDFVANKVVCEIKAMLDYAEANIKALAVKLCLNYYKKTVETNKHKKPPTTILNTLKNLSVDKLYDDGGNEFENQSKRFIFFYLFDLDEVESTFVDKISDERKADF